jgi:hypothetical protein
VEKCKLSNNEVTISVCEGAEFGYDKKGNLVKMQEYYGSVQTNFFYDFDNQLAGYQRDETDCTCEYNYMLGVVSEAKSACTWTGSTSVRPSCLDDLSKLTQDKFVFNLANIKPLVGKIFYLAAAHALQPEIQGHLRLNATSIRSARTYSRRSSASTR